jgi:hypothetical protein
MNDITATDVLRLSGPLNVGQIAMRSSSPPYATLQELLRLLRRQVVAIEGLSAENMADALARVPSEKSDRDQLESLFNMDGGKLAKASVRLLDTADLA